LWILRQDSNDGGGEGLEYTLDWSLLGLCGNQQQFVAAMQFEVYRLVIGPAQPLN
jgi:hypothetical protein